MFLFPLFVSARLHMFGSGIESLECFDSEFNNCGVFYSFVGDCFL